MSILPLLLLLLAGAAAVFAARRARRSTDTTVSDGVLEQPQLSGRVVFDSNRAGRFAIYATQPGAAD